MHHHAKVPVWGWRLPRASSLERHTRTATLPHPGHFQSTPLLAGLPYFSPPSSIYSHAHINQRRGFFTDGLPSVLVPPVLFTGLLLTLWTYKCVMTVLFQDKIIYMPYMPPFARSEKVDDYAPICRPVQWEQRPIRSLDGTKLSICVGQLQRGPSSEEAARPCGREVAICYFHGNGSSIPPRLPLLSGVLKAIECRTSSSAKLPVHYTLVALSYRGYWKSSGRASQAGIEQDAQALLQWVSDEYGPRTELVLWGQSIGAGVASTAAATWLSESKPEVRTTISSLILETPFTSIKGMLLALYPQKWLPYRYLWPFLWNHWDTEVALKRIAESEDSPPILLVPATRDEVVPSMEADRLEAVCRALHLRMVRRDVVGALHTNATIRQEGQDIVADFVVNMAEGQRPHVSSG